VFQLKGVFSFRVKPGKKRGAEMFGGEGIFGKVESKKKGANFPRGGTREGEFGARSQGSKSLAFRAHEGEVQEKRNRKKKQIVFVLFNSGDYLPWRGRPLSGWWRFQLQKRAGKDSRVEERLTFLKK